MGSTFRPGDNVFNLQRPEKVGLVSAAIATAVAGLGANAGLYGFWDIASTHELSGGRSPRSTASASASDWRTHSHW